MIVIATSMRWRGGGSVSAEMAKEMISRQGLLDLGWREFDGGLACDDYPWVTFYRECRKGDSINIATEKYFAPTIILPLVPNSKTPAPLVPTKPTPSKPAPPKPSPTKPASTNLVANPALKLDTPMNRVLSVWGIHDGDGTYRVQLFSDGTTNQKYDWKPVSRTKIQISDGSGELVDGGSIIFGG